MSDIDEKTNETANPDELKRILEDYASLKYCKTNIIAEARSRFDSKMDLFLFDALPLTNSQKEELLLSLFHSPDGSFAVIKLPNNQET